MSTKAVYNEEEIGLEELFKKIELIEKKKRWIIGGTNPTNDLKFIVRNCVVKYTPDKYDKLVVTIDEQTNDFFDLLESIICRNVEIQSIVKDQAIGIKLNEKLKVEVLSTLKKGDYVDIVVDFNNIWGMEDKYYLSLTLYQFKKTKSAQKEMKKNFFI